jgi:hypothetical protein
MPKATCPFCHHKGPLPPTFVEGQLTCPRCWTKFAIEMPRSRVPRLRLLLMLLGATPLLLLAFLRGGSGPVQPDAKEKFARNLARLGGWADVSCWRFESLFQKPGSHLENPWKTRPFSGLWNRL